MNLIFFIITIPTQKCPKVSVYTYVSLHYMNDSFHYHELNLNLMFHSLAFEQKRKSLRNECQVARNNCHI